MYYTYILLLCIAKQLKILNSAYIYEIKGWIRPSGIVSIVKCNWHQSVTVPIKKFPAAGLWYCVISPDIPLQPYGVNISVFISRNNPRQLSLKRRTQRLMGMACGGGFQSRGFRIRELQTINWNPTFTLLLYRSEMPRKAITLLKWNVKTVLCIKIIYYRVCNSM